MAKRGTATLVFILLGMSARFDLAAQYTSLPGGVRATPQYKIRPLSKPPVSLTIGGKETWAGNPEGSMPVISYRTNGPGAPSGVLPGIEFLGQQIDDTGQPPLLLSARGGPMDMKRDLSFIVFLFKAGKWQGVNYPPEAYEISIALFEAVPTSEPKIHTYGRQVSNPILLKLQIPE